MPMPFADYTGKFFGFWTVKSFYGRDKHNKAIWLCVCKCGTEKPVILGSLQQGRSKSCGCATIQMRTEKTRTHGMASTPTYKSWHQMHQRCAGKHGHQHYANKGIKVCSRWSNFENFYADMGLRPAGTTLDRIDGSKDYSPENCRWATLEQQANNKSSNRKEFVQGELLSVAQAARKYSKHISGVRHRVRKGMSLEDAVLTPFKKRKDAP
jgi:hypothetical protein